MKTLFQLLIIITISFSAFSQNQNKGLVEAKFDRYPEVIGCENQPSYKEAKLCISKLINLHLHKHIKQRTINKIVSHQLKEVFSDEEWKEVAGQSMLLDFKVGLILSSDKKWRIKFIETEFPKVNKYLEDVFKNLPRITKAGVYNGERSNFLYHVPFQVYVVLR